MNLTEAHMVRMGIPKRYWRVSLEEISGSGNPSLRSVVESYLGNMEVSLEKGAGLLLFGPNGVGKTCAVVYVGKEFRRLGYPVYYLESARLSEAIIGKVAFDEIESVWERCLSVDVLIVDDLGKGCQDSTGFGLRMLDELMRHRNSHMLITLVTTNMNLEQLEKELKVSTMHVLKECMVPVRVVGEDKREAVKRDLMRVIK